MLITTQRFTKAGMCRKHDKITYICEFCGAHSETEAALLIHQHKCVHNPGQEPTESWCPHCDLKGSEQDIERHIKVCSRNPANKKCVTCKNLIRTPHAQEVSCRFFSEACVLAGLKSGCSSWKPKEKKSNG
jgi:hypothetical protein